MSEVWQALPPSTMAAAAVAVVLALWAIGKALVAATRWRALRRAAEAVDAAVAERWRAISGGDALARSGLDRHRLYHERGKAMIAAAAEALAGRGRRAVPLRELIDEVDQAHAMHRTGGDGGWDDLLGRFLERQRQPIDRLRQFAGIVVLVGLAGTVLGFIDALPELRSAFAPVSDGAPGTGESLRVVGVLGGLGGVFVATLFGVASAAVLYLVAIACDGWFGRFAERLESVGQRWLATLMQAPGSPLEQVFRHEVEKKFEHLGDRLVDILSPVVTDLRAALETMPPLVERFSQSVVRSQVLLDEYRSGVERLGGSAEAAVGALERVVKVSVGFAEEVPRLQAESRQQVAEAVERLELPIAALSGAVGRLESKIAEIGVQVGAVAETAVAIVSSADRLEAEAGAIEGALERHSASFEELVTSLAGSQREAAREVLAETAVRHEQAIRALADGQREAREVVRDDISSAGKVLRSALEVEVARLGTRLGELGGNVAAGFERQQGSLETIDLSLRDLERQAGTSTGQDALSAAGETARLATAVEASAAAVAAAEAGLARRLAGAEAALVGMRDELVARLQSIALTKPVESRSAPETLPVARVNVPEEAPAEGGSDAHSHHPEQTPQDSREDWVAATDGAAPGGAAIAAAEAVAIGEAVASAAALEVMAGAQDATAAEETASPANDAPRRVMPSWMAFLRWRPSLPRVGWW